MNDRPITQDVTRITMAVLFIAILIASCFWIMKPFLSAIIWAAMIVIASWPLLLSIQAKLGGKRWAAVLAMTLLLLAILIVPLTFAITTIIEKAQDLFANRLVIASLRIPPPPEWLHRIPVSGEWLFSKWQEFSTITPQLLTEQISPYANKIVGWFLSQAGSVGMMIVHCILTVIISAVLYANGEVAASGVRRFVRRIAGKSGENAAILAGKAIRGVAIGIVGTALVQSFLGGAGLLLAGIPAVFVLTAVLFLFCVAQLGPALIMIPATIWLFSKDQSGWGSFMIAWTVIVATIDNFIRPILIRKGADLPLLLILAGVIGGLLSFGIIGLFIGPVMLAVSYTLLKEWIVVGEAVQGEVQIQKLGSCERN